MSLAQGNNTPTRPRIEPGSLDPESDALTTRPVRPLALTREVNLDTLSSDSSEEEIREVIPVPDGLGKEAILHN